MATALAMPGFLATTTTAPSHQCEICGSIIEHTQYADVEGRRVYYRTPCQCEKDERLRAEREEQDRKLRDRADELLAGSGLSGDRHRKQTFRSWREGMQPEAYAAARSFAEGAIADPGWRCLVLAGSVGTGKTHLAAAAARRVISRGFSADLITVPDFQMELQSTFDKDAKATTKQVMDRYFNLRLLCLDDWGTERQGQWSDSVIYSLVNHRYEAGLPLLITTNLSAQRFSGWVGVRLDSRLQEAMMRVEMRPGDFRRVLRSERASS